MSIESQIRTTISTYVNERLNEKLAKQKNEAKHPELRDKYQLKVWLADAARRINETSIPSRLRFVTHAVKFSHPEARGSSLNSDGCVSAVQHNLVGTHSLGENKTLDVVGNAASLDVAKFLSLKVNGSTLWQLAIDGDSHLLNALPGDAKEKRQWIHSFASVVHNDLNPVSHPLAKQVYWLLENSEDQYHMLQPLFPTSLAHSLYQTISNSKFSEEAALARQARRNRESHTNGFRDWPDLVSLKFGSTKPQNISQLNSERRGEIYLLPAQPPSWIRRDELPRFPTRSLFDQMPYPIYRKASNLATYLKVMKDWNSIKIRSERKRRTTEIIDDLIEHGFKFVDESYAGWTEDKNCCISDVEKYWLDPNREDDEFQERRKFTDWPQEIANLFGRWLNNILRSKENLPVGDAESKEWQHEFELELTQHLRAIQDV